jgi:hypothetical protein
MNAAMIGAIKPNDGRLLIRAVNFLDATIVMGISARPFVRGPPIHGRRSFCKRLLNVAFVRTEAQ